MTQIVDLDTTDEKSPLILLRQCMHLRLELMGRVQESFEQFSSDVLPLFVDGSRLFNRAAERQWHPDHIDFALHEVRNLEALCGQVERLLLCYQQILAAPSTSSILPSSAGTANANGQSDYG